MDIKGEFFFFYVGIELESLNADWRTPLFLWKQKGKGTRAKIDKLALEEEWDEYDWNVKSRRYEIKQA